MINKVVFITGGTRGIGRQIALIFAKAGYQLALNYHHNQKIAQEFQQELMTSFSTTVRLYPGDIGREEEVVNMTEKIYQDFGQLDILILKAPEEAEQEKSVEKTEKLNKVKRTDTISSAFENANSKRKATGEDVAQTIYFLCQDSAEYLTGNILNLAGGENIIARKMTEKEMIQTFIDKWQKRYPRMTHSLQETENLLTFTQFPKGFCCEV